MDIFAGAGVILPQQMGRAGRGIGRDQSPSGGCVVAPAREDKNADGSVHNPRGLCQHVGLDRASGSLLFVPPAPLCLGDALRRELQGRGLVIKRLRGFHGTWPLAPTLTFLSK